MGSRGKSAPDVATDIPPEQLWVPLVEPRDSYRAAADFYPYARPPPPGFERWLEYARPRQCLLGRYDRLEADLAPFRDPADPGRRSITRAALARAAELHSTVFYHVRDGRVSFDAVEELQAVAREYLQVLDRIAPHLPDIDFVVNTLDTPRTLPGEGTFAERLATTCANASAELTQRGELHGYVINSLRDGSDVQRELLPVISMTKIASCHGDLVAPPWYHIQHLAGKRGQGLGLETDVCRPGAPENLAWHQRVPHLFFRGSTTGGLVREGTPYQRFHRHRLVKLAADDPRMDVGFSAYLQCEPEVCAEMEAQYGRKPYVPEREAYRHRFLMVVDGNSFSSRLLWTMSSGSLVFRSHLFTEWYEDRIQPSVHYLPVRLDYADLSERLDWALTHDAEAHVIAQQAAIVARLHLRIEDVECYWLRLLTEYAALLQPE
ncbi:hypothetical protein WJX81_000416 [Elliptochloris bilobata]|uniref:Glycosyl transferase CAP10 domain-containing protein n=1 Tax=Elliptochloris bilobata TaxID=381761 RepID=A0AAW1S2X1_9CHLO